MKETIVTKLSRAVSSIVNAILGDGVTASTDHVRRVRKTNFEDVSC